MSENLVYKYVTADRVDVLTDCRIRFTQLDALNDPFESAPSLTQFRKGQIQRIKAKIKNESGRLSPGVAEAIELTIELEHQLIPKLFGSVFAFLSVSKIRHNLLMWSHYADSHAGFVIGFDASNRFFAPGNYSKEGLKDVQYNKRRYTIPAAGLARVSEKEMALAAASFFTKSIDWKYENEMRMLALPKNATEKKDEPGKPPIYLYDFPQDAIREVVFGLRMAVDKKKQMAEIIKQKHPNVTLIQAMMNRRHFRLDFVPYSKFITSEQYCPAICRITAIGWDQRLVSFGDFRKRVAEKQAFSRRD